MCGLLDSYLQASAAGPMHPPWDPSRGPRAFEELGAAFGVPRQGSPPAAEWAAFGSSDFLAGQAPQQQQHSSSATTGRAGGRTRSSRGTADESRLQCELQQLQSDLDARSYRRGLLQELQQPASLFSAAGRLQPSRYSTLHGRDAAGSFSIRPATSPLVLRGGSSGPRTHTGAVSPRVGGLFSRPMTPSPPGAVPALASSAPPPLQHLRRLAAFDPGLGAAGHLRGSSSSTQGQGHGHARAAGSSSTRHEGCHQLSRHINHFSSSSRRRQQQQQQQHPVVSAVGALEQSLSELSALKQRYDVNQPSSRTVALCGGCSQQPGQDQSPHTGPGSSFRQGLLQQQQQQQQAWQASSVAAAADAAARHQSSPWQQGLLATDTAAADERFSRRSTLSAPPQIQHVRAWDAVPLPRGRASSREPHSAALPHWLSRQQQPVQPVQTAPVHRQHAAGWQPLTKSQVMACHGLAEGDGYLPQGVGVGTSGIFTAAAAQQAVGVTAAQSPSGFRSAAAPTPTAAAVSRSAAASAAKLRQLLQHSGKQAVGIARPRSSGGVAVNKPCSAGLDETDPDEPRRQRAAPNKHAAYCAALERVKAASKAALVGDDADTDCSSD